MPTTSTFEKASTTVLAALIFELTELTAACVIVSPLPAVLRLRHVDIVNVKLSNTSHDIGMADVVNVEKVIIR